ncbi:MAG: galactose-1-epimerase, partial [Muribaculaceae bacterium]|nr:galactose-1-epimerase [Muribaculaceae bacterium]
FNLDGHGSGSCLAHLLKLNCTKWLPPDGTLIPKGELTDVAGTPMDFTAEKVIGSQMTEDFEPIRIGKGYDHCWVADKENGEFKEIATLRSEKSGRKLTVATTQPGVQVYVGGWLEGCPEGKNGAVYHDYSAVAIECQGCPDAPNHPAFPSQRLDPGKEYHQVIRFTFD